MFGSIYGMSSAALFGSLSCVVEAGSKTGSEGSDSTVALRNGPCDSLDLARHEPKPLKAKELWHAYDPGVIRIPLFPECSRKPVGGTFQAWSVGKVRETSAGP